MIAVTFTGTSNNQHGRHLPPHHHHHQLNHDHVNHGGYDNDYSSRLGSPRCPLCWWRHPSLSCRRTCKDYCKIIIIILIIVIMDMIGEEKAGLLEETTQLWSEKVLEPGAIVN